jgi:hypothetical protein
MDVALRPGPETPMPAKAGPGHVSAETLELYFAGVLAPLRETSVEEHIADCAWCAARARALFMWRASWRPDLDQRKPPGAG